MMVICDSKSLFQRCWACKALCEWNPSSSYKLDYYNLFLLFIKNAKSDVLQRQYDKHFQWILCVYHEFLDKYQGFLTLEINLVRLRFHDCVNSLRSNNPNEHCIQMYSYFQWKQSSPTNRSAFFLFTKRSRGFILKENTFRSLITLKS